MGSQEISKFHQTLPLSVHVIDSLDSQPIDGYFFGIIPIRLMYFNLYKYFNSQNRLFDGRSKYFSDWRWRLSGLGR